MTAKPMTSEGGWHCMIEIVEDIRLKDIRAKHIRPMGILPPGYFLRLFSRHILNVENHKRINRIIELSIAIES